VLERAAAVALDRLGVADGTSLLGVYNPGTNGSPWRSRPSRGRGPGGDDCSNLSRTEKSRRLVCSTDADGRTIAKPDGDHTNQGEP